MPNIGARSFDAANVGAFDDMTNRQVVCFAPCAQLQLTIGESEPFPGACCAALTESRHVSALPVLTPDNQALCLAQSRRAILACMFSPSVMALGRRTPIEFRAYRILPTHRS